MRLGMIGRYNEAAFATAQKKGLAFLDFCIDIGADTEDFFSKQEEIRGYMKKYGIEIGAIGRWGTFKLDEKGNVIEEEYEINRRLIDTCEALESKTFITNVNYVDGFSFEQNCEWAIAYLQKLVDYAKAKGVRVCVYNCHWNNSFINDDKSWHAILDKIPELGIKFDPSHSYYAGRDYLREMRDWGKRFYHVHIKGALMINGERFDDPPAGLDQINWNAFMGILYANGYDGDLSIEPHSATWRGELGEKGLDYSINYMRKYIL